MKIRTQIRLATGGALAAAVFSFSSSLSALSPAAPNAGDELLPLLFETLGGEEWRNDDGWLDPEVHWCDWYGVSCRRVGQPGQYHYELRKLELPDNNLVGEMTEELAELLFVNAAPDSILDLSGNDISGGMHFYPRLTNSVDLSDNAFSGPLPPLVGEWVLDDFPTLFLQRNDFSGNIPASWSDLRMVALDLSDNRLEGGHQNAIDAISPPGTGFVFLNGNPLSGELTRDVLTAPVTPRGESNIGGGIDICFTRLAVNDPEVRQWVAARHTASADFEQCLDRERSEVDATLGGSWSHPDRPGEGVSIMMLDSGAPLLYSFSFDTQGNQQWLFRIGHSGEHFLDFERIQETRGTFGEGIRREGDYTFIRHTGDFRLDRLDRDLVSLHRHYYERAACSDWEAPGGPPFPCPPPLHADRLDYQRLTELAGTACDNQGDFQEYAGAWYNPERSGEGFLIETLPNDRAVIYWFTYKPDGSGDQAWMVGQGEMESFATAPSPPAEAVVAQASIEAMSQPLGARYGSQFDPNDVESIDWGHLAIDFTHGGDAVVEWESNVPGYGSGSYELERLARPMLADCDDG